MLFRPRQLDQRAEVRNKSGLHEMKAYTGPGSGPGPGQAQETGVLFFAQALPLSFASAEWKSGLGLTLIHEIVVAANSAPLSATCSSSYSDALTLPVFPYPSSCYLLPMANPARFCQPPATRICPRRRAIHCHRSLPENERTQKTTKTRYPIQKLTRSSRYLRHLDTFESYCRQYESSTQLLCL